MPAKARKKRKVDEAEVDNVRVNSSKGATGRQADADGGSSALAELAALERRINRLHNGLDTARDVLWASRYEPELDVEALHRIIDYAHRTCYIAAPHGFVPGESQLFMMRPPAPQMMQFQQSILHQLAAERAGKVIDLYTARGDGAVDHAGPNAGQHGTGAGKAPEQRDGTRMEGAVQGVKNGSVAAEKVAEVDMVQVLKEMPQMPIGWKPGDPIPGLTHAGKSEPGEGSEKAVTAEKSSNKGAEPPSQPSPPKKKSTGFALGLEVDDLDFGLGSSSSDDDSD